jgi:hypothetical protein
MATREEKNNFSLEIDRISSEMKLSTIEAITFYCEKTGLEIEIAASLINENLKSRIEGEAQMLRCIPRSSKLPL